MSNAEPSADLVAMVDEFGQCCIGYGEWDGYGSSKCIDAMAVARRKLLDRLAALETKAQQSRGMAEVSNNVYANEADALEMSRPKWPDFCGKCTECGWTGPPVGTIEEAMRDADAHQCPQSSNNPAPKE